MEKKLYNSVMIVGPTACGKTSLAVKLSEKYGGEIISADSRQVYKGLDLGSGKDLGEYGYIEYHLIDVASPMEEFNLFEWRKMAIEAWKEIRERKRLPVFCGGTGMYLDSIVRNYRLFEVPSNPDLRQKLSGFSMEELQAYYRSLNPVLHNETDLTERHRLLRAIEIFEYSQKQQDKNGTEPVCDIDGESLEIKPLIIGIKIPREELRKRILLRLDQRFEAGLIDEVKNLNLQGISWQRLERFGLEYRFVAEYLQGKIPSFDELRNRLFIAIRQFAKRQDTWFRGMERKGVKINWITGDFFLNSVNIIEQSLFID